MTDNQIVSEIADWLCRVAAFGLTIGFSKRSDGFFTVGLVEGVRGEVLEFFERNPPYIGPMEVPIADINPDSLGYLAAGAKRYINWRESLPQ